MFWAEIWKISEFLSENFQFLEVKFSIYLYRRVFVMLLPSCSGWLWLVSRVRCHMYRFQTSILKTVIERTTVWYFFQVLISNYRSLQVRYSYTWEEQFYSWMISSITLLKWVINIYIKCRSKPSHQMWSYWTIRNASRWYYSQSVHPNNILINPQSANENNSRMRSEICCFFFCFVFLFFVVVVFGTI